MMQLRHRHVRLLRMSALSLLVVIVTAGGVVAFLFQQSPPVNSPSTEVSVRHEPAKPVSIRSTSLFVGDVYWGRYINDWSMASPLKTAYPFSRLHEFQRDTYDAWVANLECPTVAGVSQTSAQEDATLSFNCSPDYLPEAAKWFTIVSLANNHTDNQGAGGFAETKQHLDKHAIQYFGHYDPASTDDVCEVVSFPVTVSYDNNTTESHTLPVALCGYNGVFKIPPQSSIDVITRYAQKMPVIVMPHMGAEYQTRADELRTRVYRSMIDAGADAVIGNHPHWVQNAEAYKGKLIVYSMGNFIFDQQANKEVTRSAAIKITMSVSDVPTSSLATWLQLGEYCVSYHDDCLAQASTLNLEKLAVRFSYDVIGSNSAHTITKPATAAETAEIRQRLTWDTVINQLHPSTENL